ncbi:hypothetical protein CAOG_01482 [Capsaspora owczarzaki ATCC 30864]|uniref:AAR2 protein n=1 Tax=Capsaspora owczarzaki (strain ATCC 30864) TaxID=595528 RepID=A0A0D2WKK8_CAPO3|nr:hypothetical protein CAOG_01482 [Capsaspora owczarzaki ATCC 30864]KJE90133.1 hypothetical protein CAOG_001482 [Capsaspora owczarzaki ATCC 30864]|eukprot:XP_004364350.1 hypothetical protein CAOG_01482 [Capsaspora owczarzaki ATCC 30864]
MDQKSANALFEQWGCLLLLGVPAGAMLHMDLQPFHVAESFRGFKLIPPGLHLVCFSIPDKTGLQGERTGFFQQIDRRQTVVKHYNPATESFDDEPDPEQVERYRLGIREFDKFMAVYPIQTYQSWSNLVPHVQASTVTRVLPSGSRWFLHAQPAEFDNTNPDMPPLDRAAASARIAAGVEAATRALDTPVFRFAKIAKHAFPPNATPAERTRYSLDTSYQLRQTVQEHFGDDYKEFLGEWELGFVMFVLGQQLEGFEAWKASLRIISHAEEQLPLWPEFFTPMFGTLLAQLQLFQPENFFQDALSQHNFLRTCLQVLVQNCESIALYRPVTRSITDLCRKTFEWQLDLASDADTYALSDEIDPEDRPTIVE